MASKPRVHRNQVFLIGYSADGKVVERKSIAYERYYEGSSPLIDDDRYRKNLKIRLVTGEIYDSSGKLQQHFLNFYDRKGAYVFGRAVHADGQMIER
ncbi:MAG: hypothetical protein JSS02_22970 [Planctomycetes bacterium]|nr:hypothetical protein [Planctomycetota bacterium]